MLDQLDLAVHETAHGFDGGLPRLAQLMGMNEQVLRNKVNPHSDHHKLSLRESMAMMMLSGNVRLLETMASQLGYVVRPADAASSPSLMVALLMAEREHSDVVREAVEALADGHLTQLERARIRKEISELVRALAGMDRMLVEDGSC